MARRRDPSLSVMLCRDCCCGTASKHPGVDHGAQRRALLALADDEVRVRVVDCLDVCERSNVVVVRDLRRPRTDRDTWLGDVIEPEQTDAIVQWVRARGVDVPDALAPHVFDHERP